MILADLDLGDLLWSTLVFFFIVMILWIIFAIFTDLVRSDDLSGGAKALWVIFIVLLPWLAIFIYLIIRGNGMAQRSVQSHQEAQAQLNDYVRSTAGSNSSPADQIASAKALLDSGAISQAEFDQLKARALA
jgi:ABC-type multidrug transport system fused ATPase/permease subunit